MSEHKHTTGPWIWAKDYHGLFGAGPDNAVLEYYGYEGMSLGSSNRKPNARLIAAAPQLLEALELFVAYDESDDLSSNFMLAYAKAIDAARAAIAAATGAA